MKRPPPPLHLIRSFEAAARHLSFTRAAEELGYTQAAISTHIRALEKHVGRQLFIRRARSLVLTEIGEAFLPTLRQALDQIDRATDGVVTGATTKCYSGLPGKSCRELAAGAAGSLPRSQSRYRGSCACHRLGSPGRRYSRNLNHHRVRGRGAAVKYLSHNLSRR